METDSANLKIIDILIDQIAANIIYVLTVKLSIEYLVLMHHTFALSCQEDTKQCNINMMYSCSPIICKC